MQTDPSNYYLNQAEPNKSCFLALRAIILKQDHNISETVKYGMPCFCFKKKILCYLWTDKKTDFPYILFVDGNLLNHPQLEAGSRKRMKTLTINPNQDLELEVIEELLKKAVLLMM